MKFLVTGGEGFVGRQVVKALLELCTTTEITIPVRRLDGRSLYFGTDGRVTHVQENNIFDLSLDQWRTLLSGIDVVVHCAWYVDPRDYLVSSFNKECLSGSFRLAEACQSVGVQTFVGLGTCYEYDDTLDYYFEDSPLAPSSLYAKCKAELYFDCCNLFRNSSVEFLWCRVFFVYGDNEKSGRLIPYVDEKIKNGQDIELRTPHAIRDFIDVELAGRMIVSDLMSGKRGVSNICSEVGVTVRSFVERYVSQANASSRILADVPMKSEKEREVVIGRRERSKNLGALGDY